MRHAPGDRGSIIILEQSLPLGRHQENINKSEFRPWFQLPVSLYRRSLTRFGQRQGRPVEILCEILIGRMKFLMDLIIRVEVRCDRRWSAQFRRSFAQTQYEFNGGENGTSTGTMLNIWLYNGARLIVGRLQRYDPQWYDETWHWNNCARNTCVLYGGHNCITIESVHNICVMASADFWLVLAQNTCVFYGGED
jgi:hypothetical protein